jgi:hypothetical protein
MQHGDVFRGRDCVAEVVVLVVDDRRRLTDFKITAVDEFPFNMLCEKGPFGGRTMIVVKVSGGQ